MESTSDGTSRRLKLHFDDAIILNARQIDEGLRDSWFLLSARLQSIADLASHIEIAFGLHSSCPHGISLRMDCFTLPPFQPVELLKDKDIVSVHRKGASVCESYQQGRHTHIDNLDTFEKTALLHVEDKVVEEFERRTGVHEIEEEEKNIKNLSLKGGYNNGLELVTIKSQEQQVMQRKSKKISAMPSPANFLKNLVKDTGVKDHKKSKRKAKKRKRKLEGKERHQDMTNERNLAKKQRLEDQEDAGANLQKVGGQKGLITTKVQPSECDNAARVKEKKKLLNISEKDERATKKGAVTQQMKGSKKNVPVFVRYIYKRNLAKKQRLEDQKDDGANLQEIGRQKRPITTKVQPSDCDNAARVKEKRKPLNISEKDKRATKKGVATQQMKGSKKNSPVFVSALDEEQKHEEKSPEQAMNHEIVKKCSRSTLRKKAKRHWKRANLESQKNKISTGDESVKAKITLAEQGSATAANKQEDDADAEEERLPQVVKPGHVRFHDSDEDESPGAEPIIGSLQPYFSWSHGISKRKGQSWGQEKTKRGNENCKTMVEMKCDDTQELAPESLPIVEGTPQNGSIIAYRTLELTPSCCPELSEYCVGRVLDVHISSGQVKLACVPKYRIRRDNDQDAPVDESVVIETEISSLADVRLVESSQPESTAHESIEVLDSKAEQGVCRVTETKMDISKKHDSSILIEADSQVEKSDSAPTEGWLEITDAIQRKREELERQAEATGVGVASYGNGQALENEYQPESNIAECTISTRNGEIRNDLELQNKDQIRSPTNAEVKKSALNSTDPSSGKPSESGSAGRIRGWHRRAGGLGSTMAFLRSQNTAV